MDKNYVIRKIAEENTNYIELVREIRKKYESELENAKSYHKFEISKLDEVLSNMKVKAELV